VKEVWANKLIQGKGLAMKIRFHHPMVYSDTYEEYDNLCKEHFKKVCGDDVEIEHTWSKRGTQSVSYKSCDLLNALETTQHVLDAERQGFDAVIIGCALDIGLKESREVANIPVVCTMEAMMLCSCIMGKKFAIVSHGEKPRIKQENLIYEYGLQNRSAGIRTLGMSIEMLGNALKTESEKENLRDIFMQQARQAVIDEKAEVIIPGCGVLSALCMLDNITKIDDMEEIPVMDLFLPALKLVELLIAMKRIGINISRRGLYLSPPKEVIEQIREM
jgi:Asp/Glu/hydantoin racemase